MDSIGLLLMALLSLNSAPSNAADNALAASAARETRTQCVIAARADVNRANRNLQACASVPMPRSQLARLATTPPAGRDINQIQVGSRDLSRAAVR